MYGGFWLREAHSVVFYEVLRFCGGPVTNDAMQLGGSAKEGPHVRGGMEMGKEGGGELVLMNVLRILAPGGTFCRVLRGSEALWGFNY